MILSLSKLLLLDYWRNECTQVSQCGCWLGRLEVLVLVVLLVVWLLLRHLKLLVLLLLVVWHRLWRLLIWVEVGLVEGIGWVDHREKVLLVLVEPLVVVMPIAHLVISCLLVLRHVLLLILPPGLLFGCFVGLLFNWIHSHVLR